MPVELRILSGSRAGQRETFEKSVVTIGRHPLCDLRFDAHADLDVSARHAEIRAVDGQYTIHDNQSTNGTYVNDEPVPEGGTRALHDGDRVRFGAQGPAVVVQIRSAISVGGGTPATDAASPALVATLHGRRPTTERVAIAVREQTRGLKILVAAAIVVLGGLALGVFWNGQREGAKRDAEIKALLAANDRATHDFQVRLQASGDTTLMQAFKRRADSLERVVREAQERGAHEQAIQTLQRDRDLQRAFSTSDWPRVREANDPAVLFIYTEISDSGHSATGFNVTPNGRIVTNRHVVQSGSGARATRILVKFANTREWIAARIERIATEPMIDLAVIAIEKPDQKYPTVRGVSDSIDTPVGGPVSMIGYPLGTETPMEGMGTASFMARTTLTIGTISKVVPDLVQIDGYAGHGSSGSPVLDGRGRVIGVVWGGPTAAEGRIVFAVPSTRVLQLLNGGKP